ncbi:uncharacterized protein LOC126743104 [Anthonomus grandis grandis]|uniref:uncharacterized protein LOC126743104 n=1 Tax=Anthonomus grandis grandis TaxID=2921223 RepID=UPI0021662C8E|nr:uncharacterized protein LOC126743104 [Anthonomus grandis grandis]
MKVAITLVICMALFSAVMAAIHETLTEQKVQDAYKKCANDITVGVNRDKSVGSDPDGAHLKSVITGKMSVCFLKEIGLMNADNTLNITEMKQIVEKRIDPAYAKKFLEACTADKGSPEATAMNLIQCFVI